MRILRTDSHFRPTAKSGRSTASKLLRQTKNKDGIKYTIYSGGANVVNLESICKKAVSEIDDLQGIYVKEKLIDGCKNIIRESMNEEEVRNSVIQIALELTTEQEPKWQYVASKLYVERLYDEVKRNRGRQVQDKPYSN